MVKEGELYKCSVCGNLVEIKVVGGGTLVCCGKPMDLASADTGSDQTGDAEKHTPIIEVKGEKEIYVKVGKVEHPMTVDHYIQWIEISVDGSLYVKSLNAWDKPEATFRVHTGRKITARIKCNLHGIWKAVYGQ